MVNESDATILRNCFIILFSLLVNFVHLGLQRQLFQEQQYIFFRLTYYREGETQVEKRENSCVLTHPSKCLQCLGWARPQSGAKDSTNVSRLAGRNPITWIIIITPELEFVGSRS